jgi:hypothetical protein
MKFAIAKEHRDFFQKNGWIEFENFLTPSQVSQLDYAIDQTLVTRLNIKADNLRLASTEDCFLKGHDLWRSNEDIQKITCYPRFAEIASELIEKKPLRLAYDQFFPYRDDQLKIPLKTTQTYKDFLNQAISLEEVSCIQGMACGLMIALKDLKELEEDIEGVDIFPQRAGQAIFFQPQTLVNWHNLYSHLGQRFYLITYSYASAYYQLKPKDPHTHALKHLGYVFNDKLLDKLNPIIFR